MTSIFRGLLHTSIHFFSPYQLKLFFRCHKLPLLGISFGSFVCVRLLSVYANAFYYFKK